MLNNGAVMVCLKEDVDAEIAALKKQIEGLRNQLYKQKELVEAAYFKGKENGILEAFGAVGTRTCAQWSKKADLAHRIIDEYGKLSGLNNKSIQTWVRVEQMCRNYAEGG
jgi:hypothetical protein